LRYEDFLIRIATSSGGGFEVQIQSPAGEGRAPFLPPLSVDLADATAAAARRTASGERHLAVEDEESKSPPDGIGKALFNALFQGEVRDLYERSLGILAGDANLGLRIKISLDPRERALSRLQELPWELLCHPETRQYLGLSRRQPIVRHLAVPQTLKAVPWPERLRVLLVAASPADLAPLNLERERKNLREALEKIDGLEVAEMEPPTVAALREAFRRQEIHGLHFMGHGGFVRGAGVLYFETHDGLADPVSGEDLIQKLMDFPSLRLVVLNACESARSNDEDGYGGDPFSGVAQSLIVAGLPVVVAMRLPVSDDASIAFSHSFYNRIASKDPVDAAVAEGRQEMHSVDRGSFEWSIPVIFLRTPDGALFSERDGPGARQSRSLATWIFASFLMASLFAVSALWLSPRSRVESAGVARLRVLLLSPEGRPVEDAKAWTSVGGEPKQVAGGWEFDIPVSQLPPDGRITVHAAKESAFLSGSTEVRLGDDLAPSVTVRLAPNQAATVRGIVVDEAGNALEGVRVSIVGHGDETVTTKPGGEFFLPAHAADGQQVQLRAEKTGYNAVTQFHPAGRFPATLVLERH